MSSAAVSFLLGAIAMSCIVAAVFFFRFFVSSRDRLFLFFSASFFIEAVNRTLLALTTDPREGQPMIYGIRFLAFFLIVIGILDKNRRAQ